LSILLASLIILMIGHLVLMVRGKLWSI